MKDKKSFAFVYEFLPSVRCAVIVAGWGLWSFETKELAEHCARDINQAQADGIKEAVAERDARIAELERVLESLVRAGNYLKETAETHVMQTYDTRGSVGRKISEWDAALADIKTVLGKGE